MVDQVVGHLDKDVVLVLYWRELVEAVVFEESLQFDRYHLDGSLVALLPEDILGVLVLDPGDHCINGPAINIGFL